MKKNNSLATTTLEAHNKRYATARADLLIMTILTVVNIVTMFFGNESMMLFSASIPYYAVGSGYWYDDQEALLFGIIIAVISILIYLLCWFLSKKRYQWLIVATVLFSFDIIAMLYLYVSSGEIASGIFDILIHALVLYYLIAGVITGKKLKSLKDNTTTLGEGIGESEDFDKLQNEVNMITPESDNSVYKRRADTEEKFRVLAETTHNSHNIIYRRVKRNNELVIDGYVYDEIEMLIETPHVLSAKIDGELIQAGLRNPSNSFISVNGTEIVKKLRIM